MIEARVLLWHWALKGVRALQGCDRVGGDEHDFVDVPHVPYYPP